MHVQIFLGGFLAPGDGRADFRSKDFRAAAGERIEPGGLQFNQGLFDGFFGEPGEVQNFNRGETFEMQPGSVEASRARRPGRACFRYLHETRTRAGTLRYRASIKRAQRLEHVGVITERQRRMQSADDVQFGDAEFQGFPRLFNDLPDGQLKAVGVAFLARERAELARQDAVVRVVDVAVDDVAGAVAGFFPARQVGDGADGVQILGFKQPERVGLGNAFAGGDLVVEVAQFAALNEEIHCSVALSNSANDTRTAGVVAWEFVSPCLAFFVLLNHFLDVLADYRIKHERFRQFFPAAAANRMSPAVNQRSAFRAFELCSHMSIIFSTE